LQDTNGTSASGNSAFDGGAGADALKGTTSADLLAGGRGDDVLTSGGGADVICFNRGDGVDTLNAPLSGAGAGERNDTLSLGGVGFGQLQLSRDVSDLLVKVAGTTDLLRIKSWYLGSTNQTINRLQMVVDSTAEFSPGSGDPLRNSRLCVLDFVSLVNAFDAARSANPALTTWTPTDTQFVAARIGSSDGTVIGGSLAYRYATDGTLGQVGYATAVAELSSAGFGSTGQSVSMGGAFAAEARFASGEEQSASASSGQTAAATAALDDEATETSSKRPIGTLMDITAEDDVPMAAAREEGDLAFVNGTASSSADATLLSAVSASRQAIDFDDAIAEADRNQRAAFDAAAAGHDVDEPAPVPLRTALPEPRSVETAIADATVGGSPRDAKPSTGLTLTTLDDSDRSASGEIADTPAATMRSSSTSDAVTIPSWPAASDSTLRGLDQPFEASEADRPGYVDLGIGTTSDLDRRIRQVAEAWFAPQQLSQDIALSHFDEVARGVLNAQGEHEAERSSFPRSTSYARHWQTMRTRLVDSDALGGDSGWGSDPGSTALARGGVPLGAAFNPASLTVPATFRPNEAALPMFAGLQDGFERL